MPNFETDLEKVQKTFKKMAVQITRPDTQFPELDIVVPDSWPTISLAPLYDVHIGNGQHDAKLLAKHLRWLEDTPYVLSWNGGDMFENITDPTMGHTTLSNEEQILESTRVMGAIRHKVLFSLLGNHEART